MKIAYCSDIHLEFGPLEINNDVGADVLILGGDILVASDLTIDNARSARFKDFLQKCNDSFPIVFYHMGNHEHYHGDFSKTAAYIEEAIADMPNIYFQDKSWVTIPDPTEPDAPITFFGATLWTNFNFGDAVSLKAASHSMNDFRSVAMSSKNTTENGYARFTPKDALADHEEAMQALQYVADNFSKVVVSTHHAPTTKSKRPDEYDDSMIHDWYNSDLEQFIKDHPSIKVWTHGHTHAQYEWLIGDTQVLCNPRGYIGHQEIADHFELKVFEI